MSLVCKAALLWSLHLSFLILLQLRLDRAASSSWSVVFLPLWISDLATTLHAAYRRELLLFLGAMLKMLWQVLPLASTTLHSPAPHVPTVLPAPAPTHAPPSDPTAPAVHLLCLLLLLLFLFLLLLRLLLLHCYPCCPCCSCCSCCSSRFFCFS